MYTIRRMGICRIGGQQRNSYLVGNNLTKEALLSCYEKNREKFHSGEWQAFIEKPVVFDESVTVKEKK